MLKTAQISPKDFEAWQDAGARHIHTITPVVAKVNGIQNAIDMDSVKITTSQDVELFIIYSETDESLYEEFRRLAELFPSTMSDKAKTFLGVQNEA